MLSQDIGAGLFSVSNDRKPFKNISAVVIVNDREKKNWGTRYKMNDYVFRYEYRNRMEIGFIPTVNGCRTVGDTV